DGAVGRIASAYTRDPIRHEIESDSQTVDEADHRFIAVGTHEKLDKLIELTKGDDGDCTLVFVNTKRKVDSLARQLRAQGVPVSTMHGDMTQQAREKALKRLEHTHDGGMSATCAARRGGA